MRNDTTTVTTLLTAQTLSMFFNEKVAKVRSATQACSPAAFIGSCLYQFNEFSPCTAEDVRHVIAQSPAKSCLLDPLPHSLLIASIDSILPLLHLTCNSSLRSGMLPDCEKTAIITPILKKPGLDPDNPSNYRPVSNLTFLSKLIERLVCRQLTAYLEEHRLLASHQSAYRAHHSTETATLKIASDVFDAMDRRDVTYWHY